MNEAAIGQRVLILGSSGSGKSTLARALHARTGLPLIHLDSVWWKPDRTHISRAEFDRRLEELCAGTLWILDGDYSRTYEIRLRACDTVIFLDYSEEVCMEGITRRLGQDRPDMPWTEQTLDPELEALVREYRQKQRPRLLSLLADCPEKRILIFQTREETAAWLSGLSSSEPTR